MESKRNKVIKNILERIKAGEFAQKQHLPPERLLAAQLGVSRVLLREAIVALETMGVLEVRKRQGVFLKTDNHTSLSENIGLMSFWPAEFIPQIVETRLIIDVNAAKLAASRRTDDDLKKMKDCFNHLKSLTPQTEEEIKQHARYEFLLHTLIVEASHNLILSRIYEGIVSLIEKNNEMLHQNLIKKPTWQDRILEHHARIITAIEKKDQDEAALSMKQHIEEANSQFKQHQNN